jgi:2-phosphosulfolactate phosphatase
MPRLDLYPLPEHAPREALAEATVIVVDLLRASTTICTALVNGAECVMPFAEIDETLRAAERFGRGEILLGGERQGKLIPGFDLGNSPAEYTRERIAGRRILFTTTNGARALEHSRRARRVLVGAVVNRTSVASAAKGDGNVAILCAGTDGVVADEDRLAGGAIVEALMNAGTFWEPDAPAIEALRAWQELREDALAIDRGSVESMFLSAIRDTRGGRNLISIGHVTDLADCARIDSLHVVPQLDAATGEIRPA